MQIGKVYKQQEQSKKWESVCVCERKKEETILQQEKRKSVIRTNIEVGMMLHVSIDLPLFAEAW